MAENLSGMPWTQWPLAGALGAGRSDDMDALPEGFRRTPSGQVEEDGQAQFAAARQHNAEQIAEILDVPAEQEVPDAGPE